MNFDLASIGLTQEDLQARVVEAIADGLRLSQFADDEGNVCGRPREMLDAKVKNAIDAAIAIYADKVLTPTITGNIAAMTITPTNGYGEKKGPPLTITEYVAKAASEYLHEQVNEKGQGRGQDSYNWTAKSSRAFWLINAAVQQNVHQQINDALAAVNTEVAAAVSEAVKAQIGKIQNAFIAKTK